MDTMNNFYFRKTNRLSKYIKALDIIQKILFVISIYLVFGLLFQHIYTSDNGPDKKIIDLSQSQPCETDIYQKKM